MKLLPLLSSIACLFVSAAPSIAQVTPNWEEVAQDVSGNLYYVDTASIARNQTTAQYSLFIRRVTGASVLMTIATDCTDSRFQIRHLTAISSAGHTLINDATDQPVRTAPPNSPITVSIDRVCDR